MTFETENQAVRVLVLAWCTGLLGCDSADEVTFRDQQVVDEEVSIPGGGPCKRCIRGFKISGNTLKLCVDTRISYVGDSMDSFGDPRLIELLDPEGNVSSADWQLSRDIGGVTSVSCADDEPCEADKEGPDGDFMIVNVPLESPSEVVNVDELYLTFTSIGDSHFDQVTGALEWMPKIAISKVGDWPCGSPGTSSDEMTSLVEPAAVAPHSAAHIVFPWPAGGMRSCSGVLVSPLHVLTAAHCFDLPFFVSSSVFEEDIEVRFGSSSGANLAEDHDVMAILKPPPTVIPMDLAILVLKVPVQSTEAVVAPLHPELPNDHAGDWRVKGYGTAFYPNQTIGKDWGVLKTLIGLAPVESLDVGDTTMLPGKSEIILVSTTSKTAVCQGDSGSPVMRVKDGKERVAAVTSARYVWDGTWAKLEPAGGALAFDRGNGCGQIEVTEGFVAIRVDSGPGREWINSVIPPQMLGPPPPVKK